MRGQALITLIVFVAITISITTGAIIIMGNNILASDKLEQGIISRQLAENGIENALLRLLRNPDYSGETINFDNGNAVINVTKNGNNYIIVSVGTQEKFSRKIQVQTTYNNGILTIISWKEIP